MQQAEIRRIFHLESIEHDGPVLRKPQRTGFGLTLLERALAVQAEGTNEAQLRSGRASLRDGGPMGGAAARARVLSRGEPSPLNFHQFHFINLFSVPVERIGPLNRRGRRGRLER